MLKVGLTGGIGCGKSTAVDAFRALGTPIIDADQIARDLVKHGSQALQEIKKLFGKDYLFEDGSLNRALLKQTVFSDPEALRQLENIIHPRVKSEIHQKIKQINQQPVCPAYLVVDVPLLVEQNYIDMFDRIVVVDCLPDQQIKRVMQRDQLDEEAIRKIIEAQTDRNNRLGFATDVLDNSQTEIVLIDQVRKMHMEFITSSHLNT